MLSWTLWNYYKDNKKKNTTPLQRSASDSDLKNAKPTLLVQVLEVNGLRELPKGAQIWVSVSLRYKTESTKPLKLDKKISTVEWGQSFNFDITDIILDDTPLTVEVKYNTDRKLKKEKDVSLGKVDWPIAGLPESEFSLVTVNLTDVINVLVGLKAHGLAQQIRPHVPIVSSIGEKEEEGISTTTTTTKLSDSALARKLAEEEGSLPPVFAAEKPSNHNNHNNNRRKSFDLSDSLYARKLQDEFTVVERRNQSGLSDSDYAMRLNIEQERDLKKLDDEYIAKLLAEENNNRPPPQSSYNNNNNNYNNNNYNNNVYNNNNPSRALPGGQPDLDNMTYEELWELSEKIGNVETKPPGTTLAHQLPTTVYSGKAMEDKTCSVCLCEYEMGDVMKTLPCLHIYHDTCVTPWLEKHRNCPVCKYEMPS